MLSLTQPLKKTISIGDKDYKIDLSYDNVLRFYELINDQRIEDELKIDIAFEMLVPDDPDVDFIAKSDAIKEISDYISEVSTGGKQSEPSSGSAIEYYSFSKDAEYIFASFLQEYGIDLVDEQGRLRYEKFIALFRGMRDDTKMNQIIGIRAAPLPKGNSEYEQAERERLLSLKAAYSLHDGESVKDADARLDSMFDAVANMAKKGGKFR